MCLDDPLGLALLTYRAMALMVFSWMGRIMGLVIFLSVRVISAFWKEISSKVILLISTGLRPRE